MTPLEMHELAVEYYKAKERGEPFKVEHQTLDGKWNECICDPSWTKEKNYRRKPEPMVLYVNMYSKSDRLFAHREESLAMRSCGPDATTMRFIQDMDYKPE